MKGHESDNYPGHDYRDQKGDTKAMQHTVVVTDNTQHNKNMSPGGKTRSVDHQPYKCNPNQNIGAPKTGGGKFKRFGGRGR